MKTLLLALIALAACSSAFYAFNSLNKIKPVPERVIKLYSEWRAQHRKLYGSPAESDFRIRVFQEKLEMVETANAEYNAKLASNNQSSLRVPMFSLKSFSDLTEPEFKKKFTGLKLDSISTEVDQDVPALSVSEQRATSLKSLGQTAYRIPIRHQGECGSCWAFSAILTVEKHYFDSYQQKVELSQQQLVDCSEQD